MKRACAVSLAAMAAIVALPALGADDFRWQGRVATGDAIEIKGVNGGIDAVPAAGPDVEVTAVKKARRSDPESVEIKVVEHEGGVTICSVYPSASGRPNDCVAGSGGRMNVRDNDVSVEFLVRVPAGVRFVGRTVNGGIKASNLKADAEAYTVNGGIDIESGGVARGETVNGGIHASLGRSDWQGELSLKTVNGGIRLSVPQGLNADLRAQTVNGDISTDFPLTVQGRFSKRKLIGTIGSGGRQLELETVNGGIELRKKS
jgi:Putative adhesin